MSNGYRLGIWRDGDGNTIINYEDTLHGEDKKFEIRPDGTTFKVIWAHEIDAPEDELTRILKPVDLAQALIELAKWLEGE